MSSVERSDQAPRWYGLGANTAFEKSAWWSAPARSRSQDAVDASARAWNAAHPDPDERVEARRNADALHLAASQDLDELQARRDRESEQERQKASEMGRAQQERMRELMSWVDANSPIKERDIHPHHEPDRKRSYSRGRGVERSR
ncbi:hypothetical protein OG225_30670 [Nocardia sp. NBC_01377]|uniref:hypothetical protein n=1 Tax=Nocardia sp. NBC_01377 TaxID=2903595 RepID=UPI0032459730